MLAEGPSSSQHGCCDWDYVQGMGLAELTVEQRVELLDQTYDEVRRSQRGAAVWLVGGPETGRLWDATISAFVHANWIATVLCAQATCERTLASLLQMVYAIRAAPPGWEGWGLGRLITHCRGQTSLIHCSWKTYRRSATSASPTGTGDNHSRRGRFSEWCSTPRTGATTATPT